MTANQLSFNLPQDVLKQILLLLPFESIPVCKLVSREWKNLIDDPEFFKRCRDTSLALFYSNNIVYCVLVREGNIQITNTINGRCNPPFTVNPIPVDLKDGNGIRKLLSEPSKGIACVITYNDNLLFYNLLTGASYEITDSPLCKHSYIDWVCYGFGYDRHDDDCKIVWRFGRMLNDDDKSLFWVYSSRNRAWKSFKGFPYSGYYRSVTNSQNQQACPFNGVLHWVVSAPKKNVILTYDLHTCMFGEIPLPTDCNRGYVQLVELGGQLCCWIHRPIFMVCVMREYGVGESWEMLLSTDNTRLSSSFLCTQRKPAMLYECRDGRKVVLLICDFYKSLYWYDIDSNKMKLIKKCAWGKIRRTPKRKTRG